MNRKTFIRLAGGGISAAAGGWLASVSGAAVPDEATMAWRTFPAEDEPRRLALAYALLAPNPHNLQPWMADLRTPGEILLSLDPERRLPATDPFGRQIMMGAGAFLELLAMAAAKIGYQADIQLFPEGESASQAHVKPVAHIRFSKVGAIAASPLFEAILRRRTERGAYDPARPITEIQLAAMEDAVRGMNVRFGVEGSVQGGMANKAKLEEIRRIVRDGWRVELTTENTFMESMRLMRIGGAEIDRHRDGIAMPSAAFLAADKLGLFNRSSYPGADSMAIKSQLQRFDDLTASTPSYLWLTTSTNTRAAQIEAGRAYVRLNLAGTLLGLAMHPNEQALQEFPEMAPNYQEIHQLLAPGQAGGTVQMLARLGPLPQGVAVSEPAPRRGLHAHLQEG